MAKKNKEKPERRHGVSGYKSGFGNNAQKKCRKNVRIQCFGKSAIICKNIIKKYLKSDGSSYIIKKL
ncbi:hypothetical protein DWX73_05160 [Coprococcus sp. AF21-14LB]|nr:hypothetical protein DWX73_05160 [Coprococcus sp. AF21-14LB]